MSADLTSVYDQLTAHLRDYAPMLATYRKALVEAGFTDSEALLLVAALQQAMWGNVGGAT